MWGLTNWRMLNGIADGCLQWFLSHEIGIGETNCLQIRKLWNTLNWNFRIFFQGPGNYFNKVLFPPLNPSGIRARV